MKFYKKILDLYHITENIRQNDLGNVPEALREYYSCLGNQEFNNAYNNLLSPSEIYRMNGYMIFYSENQDAVQWGFKTGDADLENPPIYQTSDEEGFYLESDTMSDFLISMAYFQGLLGGLDYCNEYENNFGEQQINALRREIKLKTECTNPFMGMELYEISADTVIGITPFNGKYIIMYGSMNENSYIKIEGLLNNIADVK